MAVVALFSVSLGGGASVLTVVGEDTTMTPQTLTLVNAAGVSCRVVARNPAGNWAVEELVGPGTTAVSIPSNRRWQALLEAGWTVGLASAG